MPKIRSILVPIWFHFGRDSDPNKSEPNWHQIALNIASWDEQQKGPLSDGLKIAFWKFLASKLGAQEVPRLGRNGRVTDLDRHTFTLMHIKTDLGIL